MSKATSTIPFLGKSKAYKHTFSNGLRCIVVPTSIAPVFSYQTWYDVGSRDEVEKYSGIAHFFEHMMFKETKKLKLGVFDKTMESHGARDLNAFTSTDYTAYVQSLPKKHLDLVASLESERMQNLLFTQDQFVSEREVVRNERKQRNENNPEGQMYEELQKIAFSKHPYGRPVIGWEEDLDRMTTDDCHRFYKRFYAPNNAVIVVVGDHKPADVFKVVDKYYGKIPAADILRHPAIVEPIQKAERRKEMKLSLQVEKMYTAYKIPSADDPDQVPLTVLSAILSSGRSSRLYRAIVDSGIGMEASAGSGASKDPGLFGAQGVDEAELVRAKNKLRTEFFMGLTTNSSKANFIGHNEIVMGDFREGLKEMELVKKVKSADIKNVVQKYFKPELRSMIVGVPEA
jgi:zinc protease